MKLTTSSSALVALLFTIGASSIASADLTARCTEDPLGVADAQGRNAWAANCGYITPAAVPIYNDDGVYIVFTAGCGHAGCSPYIPISPGDACIFGLTKLGYCEAGCYTPEQKVMFDGAYTGIMNAYDAGANTVTALTEGSTLRNMSFAEQPIHTYVAGETTETIFVLKDQQGDTLKVTSEHPLVRADGSLVKARMLQPGDVLAKADGDVARLTEVTTLPFSGMVWNVQPASHNKTENILAAEGFLTGSVRFQNEWADDVFRLSLRDDLDVSGL